MEIFLALKRISQDMVGVQSTLASGLLHANCVSSSRSEPWTFWIEIERGGDSCTVTASDKIQAASWSRPKRQCTTSPWRSTSSSRKFRLQIWSDAPKYSKTNVPVTYLKGSPEIFG